MTDELYTVFAKMQFQDSQSLPLKT